MKPCPTAGIRLLHRTCQEGSHVFLELKPNHFLAEVANVGLPIPWTCHHFFCAIALTKNCRKVSELWMRGKLQWKTQISQRKGGAITCPIKWSARVHSHHEWEGGPWSNCLAVAVPGGLQPCSNSRDDQAKYFCGNPPFPNPHCYCWETLTMTTHDSQQRKDRNLCLQRSVEERCWKILTVMSSLHNANNWWST